MWRKVWEVFAQMRCSQNFVSCSEMFFYIYRCCFLITTTDYCSGTWNQLSEDLLETNKYKARIFQNSVPSELNHVMRNTCWTVLLCEYTAFNFVAILNGLNRLSFHVCYFSHNTSATFFKITPALVKANLNDYLFSWS